MSWVYSSPGFHNEMAKQSRTCVFTAKYCAVAFLWNCNFFCTRGSLVRRVWWPSGCQYPQECFGLEQEKAQIWFMEWFWSTQSGFPLEKRTYQINIIWSSIYLIELIYQEFIKHIYNIPDKSKIMCENKYKIHKIWSIILYVYIVHLTLRKIGLLL